MRRGPLTADQQDLAARYLPLARSLSQPFWRAWPSSYEEFDSAACLGLVEAARTFDPTRGVKFGTFVRHRILGSLRDVQRGLMAPRPRRRGKDTPAANPPPDVGAELEASDEVVSLLRQLPRRHAAACRGIYLEAKTQNEVARDLGCSQSRLSVIHRESLAMLNGSWSDRVRAIPLKQEC